MNYLRLTSVLFVFALIAGCSSQGTKQDSSAPTTKAKARTATDSGIVDNIHVRQRDRYHLQQDGGPAEGAIVPNAVEPVPRYEALSKYGNKSPYTVNGKTYHVLNTSKGYKKRGQASWYGNKFHGYMTSSMEPYDMHKFTAASRDLPLPSYVRVTNLANRKSVVVRVNDRGPFVPGRIIDLSYAAAHKIGISDTGVGQVEVVAIDVAAANRKGSKHVVQRNAVAQKNPTPAPTSVKQEKKSGVWLQVGSFAKEDNARNLIQLLQQAQLASVDVVSVQEKGDALTRVRMGPLDNRLDAEKLRAQVRQLGLPDPQIMVN